MPLRLPFSPPLRALRAAVTREPCNALQQTEEAPWPNTKIAPGTWLLF